MAQVLIRISSQSEVPVRPVFRNPLPRGPGLYTLLDVPVIVNIPILQCSMIFVRQCESAGTCIESMPGVTPNVLLVAYRQDKLG